MEKLIKFETKADFDSAWEGMEYPSVALSEETVYIKENTPTEITFTLDNVEYTVKEGTTWFEFIKENGEYEEYTMTLDCEVKEFKVYTLTGNTFRYPLSVQIDENLFDGSYPFYLQIQDTVGLPTTIYYEYNIYKNLELGPDYDFEANLISNNDKIIDKCVYTSHNEYEIGECWG